MKELRLKYSIRDLSDMLLVSGSGYYEWIKRKPSKRQQEEGVLEVAIKAAHNRRRAVAVMDLQNSKGLGRRRDKGRGVSYKENQEEFGHQVCPEKEV